MPIFNFVISDLDKEDEENAKRTIRFRANLVKETLPKIWELLESHLNRKVNFFRWKDKYGQTTAIFKDELPKHLDITFNMWRNENNVRIKVWEKSYREGFG